LLANGKLLFLSRNIVDVKILDNELFIYSCVVIRSINGCESRYDIRFLWNEEPTDEQPQALMREVGEDIRCQSERMEQQVKEKLGEEYANALAARQEQV
jgi:hypothetical protein